MTREQSEVIQKAGATARAMGRSEFDNPYLKADKMPAATGEAMDEWQAKHDAWHFGWTAENAMRANT